MNSPGRGEPITTLLRRVKGGDRSARRELFALLADRNEFGNVVISIVRGMLPREHPARRFVDTGDVLQSTLRTGLRHVSDFRGETEGELYGWLRAIVRTKVQRAARGHVAMGRPSSIERVDRRKGSGEVDESLARIIDRETTEILHTAIARLPLDQRVVVELRLRGVRAPEIGQMLGLQPSTVRKRESRAIAKLRKLVE